MTTQSVQVKLELGHKATLRKKPSTEGFTHDWTIFVRGPEGSNIQHFVEKVVFHLHESFPKPKRVIKEPPYSVSESGYGSFNLPIEIYFRSKEEPRKIKFDYDLFLHLNGSPPVNHLRCEKLTFQNPSEDFRRKLIKAGGVGILSSGDAAPTTNQPATTPTTPQTSESKAFTELFGTSAQPDATEAKLPVTAEHHNKKKKSSHSKHRDRDKSKSRSSTSVSVPSPHSPSSNHSMPKLNPSPPDSTDKGTKHLSKHDSSKHSSKKKHKDKDHERSKSKHKDSVVAHDKDKSLSKTSDKQEKRKEKAEVSPEKHVEKSKEKERSKHKDSSSSKSHKRSHKGHDREKSLSRDELQTVTTSPAKHPKLAPSPGSTTVKKSLPPMADLFSASEDETDLPAPIPDPKHTTKPKIAEKKVPEPTDRSQDFMRLLQNEMDMDSDEDMDISEEDIDIETTEMAPLFPDSKSTSPVEQAHSPPQIEASSGFSPSLTYDHSSNRKPQAPSRKSNDKSKESRTVEEATSFVKDNEPIGGIPAVFKHKGTEPATDHWGITQSTVLSKSNGMSPPRLGMDPPDLLKSTQHGDLIQYQAAQDRLPRLEKENHVETTVIPGSQINSKPPATDLPSLQPGFAPNGETFELLLTLQQQLNKTKDEATLSDVVRILEESGEVFAITDSSLDFDLCYINSTTVHRLKHCLLPQS